MKQKVESKKEFATKVVCHACGGINVTARINSYDFNRMDMYYVEFICNDCHLVFATKRGFCNRDQNKFLDKKERDKIIPPKIHHELPEDMIIKNRKKVGGDPSYLYRR